MIVVLLSGASGSGKSSLATELSKLLSAVIVPQDAFYNVIEFDVFPYDKEYARNGCLETGKLIQWKNLVLTALACKKYSNVIIEGHRVLENEELKKMADFIFFLDAPKSICKTRFMNRNSVDLTSEQMMLKGEYFESITWTNHCNYVAQFLTAETMRVNVAEKHLAMTLKNYIFKLL